jgi:hypothetical protein
MFTIIKDEYIGHGDGSSIIDAVVIRYMLDTCGCHRRKRHDLLATTRNVDAEVLRSNEASRRYEKESSC